ncbi:transposase [Rhodothermus sp. AH-315-K08]|nr:transposase [Rhodothermus sp. AH-315-K08]
MLCLSVGNARGQGGLIPSDGDALLLREVEHRSGILRRAAGCFTDQQDAGRIERPVKNLLAQRIYGLSPEGAEAFVEHAFEVAGMTNVLVPSSVGASTRRSPDPRARSRP